MDRRRKRQVLGLEPGQGEYRILVVEDNKENRELLVRLLESIGFAVRQAINGQEAVDIFGQWQPHFIWMDIRMPVLDGLEATRRIKATEAGRRCTVVALTASGMVEEREPIVAAGCDGLLLKPFQEEALLALMEQHLGLRYVYAAESDRECAPENSLVVRPERLQLASLPEDLQVALHTAVLVLDCDRAIEVINRIALHDAAIADYLRSFVDRFDFKNLLHLLEQSDAEPMG